jgi:ATP synthase subunit 6
MINILYAPLEQFNILILKPINILIFIKNYKTFDIIIKIIDFSFNNHSLYLIICFFFIFFIFYIILLNTKIIGNNFQFLIENIYLFILDILKQQAGFKAIKYFPLYLYLFIFLLISNLLGLLPFSFTTTSHIIQNFLIAFSFFLAFTILGIINLKFKFIDLFIPSGVPLWLLPLLIIIEIISYISRSFSLSIRLFANMMAGHTLLYILSSFAFSLAKVFFILFLIPIIVIYLVYLLEIGIACLQAYVFIVLLSIYLNNSLYPAH